MSTANTEKSATTVTVACKMPHGLQLRLFTPSTVPDPQRDGSVRDQPINKPRTDMAPVVLKGYLDKYDPSAPPQSRNSTYGYTEGVDKAFFDEWMHQNRDTDIVKNNLVFAVADDRSARAKGREMDPDTRSGLEPLDPSKLKGPVKSFSKDD